MPPAGNPLVDPVVRPASEAGRGLKLATRPGDRAAWMSAPGLGGWARIEMRAAWSWRRGRWGAPGLRGRARIETPSAHIIRQVGSQPALDLGPRQALPRRIRLDLVAGD